MKGLVRKEKGFTLIEVLVALAILGLIGAAFLMALATASKAIIIADERTTAESLARSQMEFVKDLEYIYYNAVGHSVYGIFYEEDGDDGTPPPNYSIVFIAEPIDPTTGLPYTGPDGDGVYGQDDGIQKLEVTVSHQGNTVLTLEGYKVDR